MVDGLKNRTRSQRRTGNTGREAWGLSFSLLRSGINIVNEITRRGICDRQHVSSSQSMISTTLRVFDFGGFVRPILFFSCQSLIVCKTWSMYLCQRQVAYSRVKKKKKRHSRSVCDRRRRAHNEYRGFLFIVHLWQLNNTHFIHAKPRCYKAGFNVK